MGVEGAWRGARGAVEGGVVRTRRGGGFAELAEAALEGGAEGARGLRDVEVRRDALGEGVGGRDDLDVRRNRYEIDSFPSLRIVMF